MAHSRVAMQIKRAAVFQHFTHVPDTDSHCRQVSYCSLAEPYCVECGEEFEQIQIELLQLVQCVFVRNVAPCVCECLFLCLSVFQVNFLEEHVVIAFGIEGRVNIDEVYKSVRVLVVQFLQYIEAVAEIQCVHRLATIVNNL